MEEPETAPPGWYETDQGLRWWDGEKWGLLASEAEQPGTSHTAWIFNRSDRRTILIVSLIMWTIGVVVAVQLIRQGGAQAAYGVVWLTVITVANIACWLWQRRSSQNEQ